MQPGTHKGFVVIDCETQSEVDLRKTNPLIYSLDASTKPLCFAFKINNSKTQIWIAGNPIPARLKRAIEKGYHVIAHNYYFEKCIWQHIMVARYSWPEIKNSKWICTASISRCKSLPASLAGAGGALKLSEQKDNDGHKIMLKLCKPRTKTKKHPETRFWNIEEKPEDFKKLYEYCVQDVDVTYAIFKKLGELSEQEFKYFTLDQKINDVGIKCNMKHVEGAIKVAGDESVKYCKQLKKLTDGAVETPNQHKKFKKWINEQGVETDSTGKDAVEIMLKTVLPENVKQALLVKKAIGKSSISKYSAIKNRITPEGILHDILVYCGASRTRRWTSNGVQLQNIARGTIKKVKLLDFAIKCFEEGDAEALQMVFGTSTTEVASSCLRGVFVPKKNNVFICSDYSAIEARVANWVAEDKAFLQNFFDGVDVYKLLASDIYKKPIEEITDDQRFVGKQGELGLSYQLSATGKDGTSGFKAGLKKFGVEISEDEAKRIVKIYRTKHKKIVKTWYGLQEKACIAIEDKTITKHGKIKFDGTETSYLKMILPSNRSIYYWYPKVSKSTNKYGFVNKSISYYGIHQQSKKWVKLFTYGGKLFENAVQALSRDLLAGAMYKVDKAGFDIVLTVHDEILSEIKNSENNQKKLNQFNKLLCVLPDWGEGLPLNVEGWFGYRYKK